MPFRVLSVCALICLLMFASSALAWVDLSEVDAAAADRPDGIHVIDGSYVMNVSELQVNITNFGLIGSQFSSMASYAHAPSGQWPASSGNEYLWAAGLWVGGILDEEVSVSTGQFEREFRPLHDVRSTIYESVNGVVRRPAANPWASGRRLPDLNANDDGDRQMDEEVLNGRDDDGDGMVDEDYGQKGTQMMVCTMYDNTPLSMQSYPDHRPLNLKIEQTSFAFDSVEFRNFVALDYTITNVGTRTIEDVFLGFLVDCDIGPRERAAGIASNDLVGFWEGSVQATDGLYTRLEVAYMYDADPVDPLPGYFGVLFFDNPMPRVGSFQVFSVQQSYEAGGDPVVDAERYELMSRSQIDRNPGPDRANDYRFLISIGPWAALQPQRSLDVCVALVVGEGLEDLLVACADIKSAWNGIYYDMDHNPSTGVNGRETQLCFQGYPPRMHPIWFKSYYYFDDSCIGPFMDIDLITRDDFTEVADDVYCIWVNMDNCDECDRITGQHCTHRDRLLEWYWNCNRWYLSPQAKIGCTGMYGAETQITWVVEHLPPPPPNMRVWPRDKSVHVYWNNYSEVAHDLQLHFVDFESYRIWRADDWDRPAGTSEATGPGTDLWHVISEYDVENSYIYDYSLGEGQAFSDTLNLGLNTGFEDVSYRPVCLADERFTGLAEAMQAVVNQDVEGLYEACPPLRDANGSPIPGREALLQWESHPTVLDTFFMSRARAPGPGVVRKRAMRFYEYIDRDVHNGFIYFYSVTATDHEYDFSSGHPVIVGNGLAGSPHTSFVSAVPGSEAQTSESRSANGSNIFVYPNPATRESLAEFQQLRPREGDPTGWRIMFANLPHSVNQISIYSLSGDLLQTIRHDGTEGHGEQSWNLVSRNGQEVVSGIYLYTVESSNPDFDTFTGRFVIIR